jgi:hypothetical protein
MDVNPNAKPVFFGECEIGHLNRDLSVFLLALLDQNTRIHPTTITVDDPEFAELIGMGFHEQWLEQASIGFDLPLELLIDLSDLA